MAMSNYPNGFENGLTIRNQPILSTHSGNIFWVGRTPEGQAGSNGYSGTFNWPFATIDFAIGKCTANHGDIILVKAGHTETITAAGAIACDVAGVSIIGIGTGADRPTVTFGSTDNSASITISAASVTIENIIGTTSDDALSNPFNVTGNDCWLDIEWQDASSTVEAARAVLATTVSGLNIKLKYVGFTTGNACVNAVRLVEVTGARISIDAYGEFSTGIVEMVTTASTDVLVDGYFYNDNVALTKNVVNTGGLACTWFASGYDGKGGYYFSGGSASALASDDVASVGVQVSVVDSRIIATTTTAIDSVGVQVSTVDSRIIATTTAAIDSVGVQVSVTDSRLIVADAAVDSVGLQVSTADSRIYYQSKRGASKSVASITTANLFTVSGGCVKILNVVGYITTAIQDAANNAKLVMTPTGGTATDICSVLNVQNSGQYGLLTITGTFANAMVLTATAGVKAGTQASAFITSPGILSLNCDATTTGAIDWYIEYMPMDADAIIIAI
jgi:hypothetical protein